MLTKFTQVVIEKRKIHPVSAGDFEIKLKEFDLKKIVMIVKWFPREAN